MYKWLKYLTHGIIYFLFACQSLIVLLPIYVMVSASFKSNLEMIKNPMGFPSEPFVEGYIKAFKSGEYLLFFRNSLIVAFLTIALVLFFTTMAAYAIGRYRFKGSGALYFFFLAGLIIPLRLGTLNLFELVRSLKIYDNLLSLILIYSAKSVPLAMYILVPFVQQIPTELIDAARVDGCFTWGLYSKIVIPLIRPAMATVALLTFLSTWNDFYYPLIFLSSSTLYTLPLGVAKLFGQYSQDLNTAFSVLTVAIIPTTIIYLLLSRNFIEGLMKGAVKG
jgi:raffinose/stachyose/melibiose transport system permease protein